MTTMQDPGPTYRFGTRTRLDYATAVEHIRSALKDQGFGVLTEIDVRQTLKEKRGVDIPPYLILGVCNPVLAEQALKAEPGIGVLLPCTVVVREDEHGTVVEALDPEAALGLVDNPAITTLAHEASERLMNALLTLAAPASERTGRLALQPGPIRRGQQVIAGNEAIGEVEDVLMADGAEYMHVRRFGVGHDELYIPTLAVSRVVANRVFLDLSAPDLLGQAWHERPVTRQPGAA